jgi:hypothetical protein
VTKHWLSLETGANQRYVFGSNRLRHVVGASQLVHDVGMTWAKKAALETGLAADAVVQATSGKALILVDSPDAGREVIRRVTRKALTDAPGLQVTGVVGPGFDEARPYVVPADPDAGDLAPADDIDHAELDHAAALRVTHAQHARVRAARRSPLLRDRVLPWHELCRETGLPAAGDELYGDDPDDRDAWHPASAPVLARSAARRRAGTRFEELLGELADVIPKDIDELRHDGWVAVAHADGNGVGRLFLRFPLLAARAEKVRELSLDTHARYQRAFAEQLERATQEAFRVALGEALEDTRMKDRSGTLMPIVVGGDDVTFACHAALAIPLVRRFAQAFEEQTRAAETVAALLDADRQSDRPETAPTDRTPKQGLTAAAGVAIVKPHHPFAAAYDLAAELTRSAKETKAAARDLPVSSFDLHVAHESTLSRLPQLRAALRVRDGDSWIARHGGPYALVGKEDPRLLDIAQGQRAWLLARRVELLDGVIGGLGAAGWLSAARAHELRGALDRSLGEYLHQVELAWERTRRERRREGREPLAEDTKALLGVQTTGRDRDHGFVRLVDAMLLAGIQNVPGEAGDEREQTGDAVGVAG